MASEICDSQLKPSGKFAPLFENHYFFNGKSHEMSIGPCSSSQTVGHYQGYIHQHPSIIPLSSL